MVCVSKEYLSLYGVLVPLVTKGLISSMFMATLSALQKVIFNQIVIFKACVSYFLSNFYFSPNDNPSKAMKNVLFHLKSSFRSSDM